MTAATGMVVVVVLASCGVLLRPAVANVVTNVVTTPLTPTSSMQQPVVADLPLKTVLLPQTTTQQTPAADFVHRANHYQHQLQGAQPIAVETGRQVSSISDTGNWRLVGRLLLECSRTGDLMGCLKLKAVTSLGRALSSNAPIPLLEDVSLAKDPEATVDIPSDAPQSETELEASLPRSMTERASRLDRMLMERLDAFVRSRTVQFNMPLGLGMSEGRGKGGLGGKKGYGGYVLLLVAGLKAMMVQSALGGIAMVSGKALLVAKIALLLALLCCLKKGGGEESKAQIVYAAPAPEHGGGGGGGGWQSGGGGDWNRRSASDPNFAHNYAYNAHHRH